MQIEINIDEKIEDTKVIIVAKEITPEINELIMKINNTSPKIISGVKDDMVEVLEQENIIRVYLENSKTYVSTTKGKYLVKLRLYEVEERLNPNIFVRISNSEIINIKKTEKFDLSFSGTICVKLAGGEITYTSRRYVSKIKKLLGV